MVSKIAYEDADGDHGWTTTVELVESEGIGNASKSGTYFFMPTFIGLFGRAPN